MSNFLSSSKLTLKCWNFITFLVTAGLVVGSSILKAADTESPEVSFIYPADHATLMTNWSSITGAVSDTGGSGIDRVDLNIIAPDGRFWDGTNYVEGAVLSTVISGTTWARTVGLPTRTNLQAGTYTLIVEAFDHATNMGFAVITIEMQVPPPPPNDDFVNSQLLTGTQGSVQGTTAGATREAGEPNHAFFEGTASIWYRWVAPERGILTLDTTGSGFDTLLAVYTGGSVSNLTSIESDHGSGQFGGSRLQLTTVADTTYFIAIDGRAGSGDNSYGNSTLGWTLAVEQPRLAIRGTNGARVAISWSAGAQNFKLYSTPSLFVPSWQLVGTAPVPQGDQMVVTVPFTGAPAFFRLQKP